MLSRQATCLAIWHVVFSKWPRPRANIKGCFYHGSVSYLAGHCCGDALPVLDFTAYFSNPKQVLSHGWFCLRITRSQTARRQTKGDGNENGAAKASVANMTCRTLYAHCRIIEFGGSGPASSPSLLKFQRSKTTHSAT